jgi:Outer membrane protein beta-barrel domain
LASLELFVSAKRLGLLTLKIRIILLVASLSIPSGLSHAQFFIGVSGGSNSSSFVGDNSDKQSYQSIRSITAALILEYQFADDISISLQPGYVQNGTVVSYESQETESGVEDSLSVLMNSLSLPLLVRVSVNDKWFIDSGPVFWQSSDVTTKVIETGEELDFGADYNAWDAGLIFGVGRFFHLKKFKPFVEFRVVWGITNLVRGDSDQARVRHSGMQLILGTIYSL